MLRDPFDHAVIYSFLDVQTRTRAAALPMVEENGTRSARDRGLKISVFEDHVGRLPAQFERHLFQITGRRMHDELSDFSRSGECDFVDI